MDGGGTEHSPQQQTGRLRTLAAGVLALLLAATLLGGASLYRSRQQALALAQNSSRATVQLLERSIGNLLEKVDVLLQVTADERVRRAARGDQDPELAAFIERQFRRLPELDSLRIADRHGTVLLGSGTVPAPAKPVSMADRDYFRFLRDHPGAGMVLSKPLIGKISGKWVITCARRITLPDGGFGGVAFGVITLQQFSDLFARADLGENGVVLLRSADLGLITRYGAGAGSSGVHEIGSRVVSDTWQRLLAQGATAEGSYLAASPADGVRRVYSYRLLEPFRLYLQVGLSLDDYLQSWRRELLQTLLAVTGVWAVGLLVLRQLSRQQRQRQLEQQVAEGALALQQSNQELARNGARLQALLDISRFEAADTQQLLDYALEQVLAVTASSIGYIYHYHEDRQEFVLNTWSNGVMPSCSVAEPQTVYQLDKTGIWVEAVRQRRPILINDFAADNPLKKGYPDGHVHLDRFLTVPVFDENRDIVAVVGVANKAQPYTEQDTLQLELMMVEVWRIARQLELKQRVARAGNEWQATFDAISDSVSLLDSEQRVLRCNLATTRLLQRPFREIVGRRCWELVHGTDHRIDDCPFEAARQSRRSESRLIFEGNRWLKVTVDPLLDEQGEVSGAVHIIHDDSERVAAEQSLQELLYMLEEVQNELYVLNPANYRFEYVNQTAQCHLGYPLQQLLTMSLPEVCTLDRQQLMAQLAPLLTGEQELVRFESVHRRADGSCYPVEVYLQLVETRSGSRCLAVVHDITERLQGELRLRDALQEARHFRAALDFVNAFIYIKDLESRYVYANRPTLELLGCSADELPGRSDRSFFSPEDAERLRHIDERVFNGEQVTEEIPVTLPDGRQRIFLDIKTPFFADSDNQLISGLMGIASDITEIKQSQYELQLMQSQLLQNEKLASIGQLSAGIAHEINNPMGFINSNLGTLEKYVEKFDRYIAFLEQALRQSGGDLREAADLRASLKLDYVLRDIRQLLAESVEGAERVMRIVQDLKNFSRSDTSQTGRADLNQCLDSTINIIWNQIKYLAELERDYGELPKVLCNIQQINQVFMNLLVNAAHAIEARGGEEPGRVTVTTRVEGEYVRVSVSDTGCGMSDEVRRRIFEPFFTTKEVGKGTGLGLSISYDIVRKHGGTLEVESEEGRGSTFTIRLPIQAAADRAPQAECAGREEQGG